MLGTDELIQEALELWAGSFAAGTVDTQGDDGSSYETASSTDYEEETSITGSAQSNELHPSSYTESAMLRLVHDLFDLLPALRARRRIFCLELEAAISSRTGVGPTIPEANFSDLEESVQSNLNPDKDYLRARQVSLGNINNDSAEVVSKIPESKECRDQAKIISRTCSELYVSRDTAKAITRHYSAEELATPRFHQLMPEILSPRAEDGETRLCTMAEGLSNSSASQTGHCIVETDTASYARPLTYWEELRQSIKGYTITLDCKERFGEQNGWLPSGLVLDRWDNELVPAILRALKDAHHTMFKTSGRHVPVNLRLWFFCVDENFDTFRPVIVASSSDLRMAKRTISAIKKNANIRELNLGFEFLAWEDAKC